MSEKTHKKEAVQASNILAGKAVAQQIRTSLGPRGMDKMISSGKKDVTISNDGATILKQLKIDHPIGRALVQLSEAQDVNCGDGTTSVVVLAGALLNACEKLLGRSLHPTQVSDAFGRARDEAVNILQEISIPIDIADRDVLVRNASTSLNSKMVSSSSPLLSDIAVDAVLRIMQTPEDTNVDLKNIHIVKKLGETVDESELVNGLVLSQKASHTAGGPSRVRNAKIGLIQFCISPPKTDMECSVVIKEYSQMDRVLREERQYLLNICKAIKKSGCNVLLVQKSILRDAVSDQALHFLSKLGIMVLKDIDRTEIEFICRSLGCLPIASVDGISPQKLGSADLVEEVPTADGKYVRFTGVRHPGRAVSVLLRGPNRLMLDELDRSLHDAFCVVRSLVKRRFLIPGGGAPEVEVARRLYAMSQTLSGVDSYCFREFAEALEVIPSTLAENSGLSPVRMLTDLRARHAAGEMHAGINMRRGTISNMVEADVVQPLLVSVSAIQLATETVQMILKIDDIIPTH